MLFVKYICLEEGIFLVVSPLKQIYNYDINFIIRWLCNFPPQTKLDMQDMHL